MKFRLLPRWAQLRKLGRVKFVLVFSSTVTLAAFLGDVIFGSAIAPEKHLLRFLCWSLFGFFMWRRAEASFERYGENEKS
jgi:hypothetical protein